jgi:hypothetical protein
MLNDEIEKKINKKGPKKQPELTCQTCNSGHKIEITL